MPPSPPRLYLLVSKMYPTWQSTTSSYCDLTWCVRLCGNFPFHCVKQLFIHTSYPSHSTWPHIHRPPELCLGSSKVSQAHFKFHIGSTVLPQCHQSCSFLSGKKVEEVFSSVSACVCVAVNDQNILQGQTKMWNVWVRIRCIVGAVCC